MSNKHSPTSRHNTYRQHLITRFIHTFSLSGFFISQLTFDVLQQNQEFFIAHRASFFDVILITVVIGLVLPVTIGLIAMLTLLLGKQARILLYTLLLVILFTLPVLYFVHHTFTSSNYLDKLLLCAIVGAFLAGVYWRFKTFRTTLTYAASFVLIFPVIFIVQLKDLSSTEPTNNYSIPQVAVVKNGPPIIFIVLDELSTTALLDKDKNINQSLFPHITELAQSSYWYRNATTVSTMTKLAVPALLSGQFYGDYPSHKEKVLTHQDMPINLCTILYQAGYDITASEIDSQLCPDDISTFVPRTKSNTQQITSVLADISVLAAHMFIDRALISDELSMDHKLANFIDNTNTSSTDTNTQGVQEFISSINTNNQQLYVMHTLHPHMPYQRFPNGTQYTKSDSMPIPGYFSNTRWSTREDHKHLLAGAYQRYVLQTQYVDSLIGQLTTHLKQHNLYDKSIIIITSDHGVTFRPGKHRRHIIADQQTHSRPADNSSTIDLTKIPLLIKFPHQNNPQTIDQPVTSDDVLPTILSYLDITVDQHLTGRNLLADNVSELTEYTTVTRTHSYSGHRRIHHSLDILSEDYYPLFYLEKLNPDRALVLRTDWDEYLDQEQSNIPALENSFNTNIDNLRNYEDIDTSSNFIPALISGHININAPDKQHKPQVALAVLVNKKVKAITRTFVDKKNHWNFYVLLPENVFIDGQNNVEAIPIAWLEDP